MTISPHPTFCTQCGQELVASALFCPACGTPRSASADADPLIGQVLGQRFLVLERMGHGGSGTMYRGEHTTLRRRVAIKLLHHELCQNDLAVERFRREAITVSNIDNDHIVEIYDFGRAPDERLYLVMELLEGESLQRAIEREKRLAIDKIVDILIQTGEALSEAHAMGYVHRDLRPRNIFLAMRRGRSNFVKLLDFGLAKLVADEGQAATTSLGLNFGDPKYMSPEQARGDAIDRRSDIYSLGCITYEMLVGHPPFARGKAFEILAGHVETMPAEPRALRHDVPAWLSSTVMRMLAKQPDARFVTVYRLVEALRAGLDTGSVMSDDVARRRETIQPPISSRIPALRPPTNAPIAEPSAQDDAPPAVPAEQAPSQVDQARAGEHEHQSQREDGERGREDASGQREPQPSDAQDPDEDSAAGLSGAWFADGEMDADAQLDEQQEQRLAAARNNVAHDAGTSFDELYYEPKSKRKLLIAGAIGGVVMLVIILAIAWPSSGARTSSDTDEPQEHRGDPAGILAQIDVPDAGPPAGDAGAFDAAIASADAAADKSNKPTEKPRPPANKDRDKPRRPPDPEGGGDDDAGTTTAGKNAKQAAFYAQVGQTQLRNGDIDSAKESFKKALDLDAGNADALMGMGELELENGSSAAAIKLLQRAARKKSGSAHVHTLLGDAYLDAGKAEKAVEQFKQALRLDPDSARARNGFNEASAKLPPPKDDI